MKTGLVSISFRKMSPEEIVPMVVRCGLESIEWGGDVHVLPGDIERAREVGEMTRRAGLEVACYGSYYRLTDAEGSPEAVVATAKALDAPLIRVWAGMLASSDASEPEREMVVRNARKIADMAAEENIDIAFEYHCGTLTDETASALALLKAVEKPNVYTLWQPPVGFDNEACMESLRAVEPWVKNIHVFTWQDTDRLPLEQGEAKWKPLLERIAGLGGEHNLMLEFVRNDDPSQLAADAECLNKWLKEIKR